MENASKSSSENAKFFTMRNIRISRPIYRLLVRFIGPAITVGGVVLSLIQVKQASDQTELAKDQTKQATKLNTQMAKVLGQMSTKRIGEFPANMPKVLNLLKRTKKSLYVLTDVPAYGQFSSPLEYMEYKNWFIKNGGKFDIRIVTYSPKKRSGKIKQQFNFENENFSAWIKKDSTRNKVINYLKITPGINKIDSLNEHRLFHLLETVNIEFINSLRNSEIDYQEEDVSAFPLFLWIRDEEEAVISFINFPRNTTEVVFESVDQSLVGVLRDIFLGAHSNSKSIHKTPAQSIAVK